MKQFDVDITVAYLCNVLIEALDTEDAKEIALKAIKGDIDGYAMSVGYEVTSITELSPDSSLKH